MISKRSNQLTSKVRIVSISRVCTSMFLLESFLFLPANHFLKSIYEALLHVSAVVVLYSKPYNIIMHIVKYVVINVRAESFAKARLR